MSISLPKKLETTGDKLRGILKRTMFGLLSMFGLVTKKNSRETSGVSIISPKKLETTGDQLRGP